MELKSEERSSRIEVIESEIDIQFTKTVQDISYQGKALNVPTALYGL